MKAGAFHFERTQDWETVRRIVTHPKVYRHIADDFSPAPEDWQPVKNDRVWYVLLRERQGGMLGLFILLPENAICWKIHVCLLPEAWGQQASLAAQQLSAWIWKNTPCRRLVGEIPAYNRLSINFALRAGMKQFGVNERSCLKGGELLDQVLVGLSRPASSI